MSRMQRWLDLEGCDNFRDLGGYVTGEGRTTRWRTLFRSDALGRLTGSAVDRVRDLGIKTVIDLRTPDEVGRSAVPTWLGGAGARCVSFPMANPEIDALRRAGAAGMGQLYLWNLEGKRDAFAKIVRLLTEEANLPSVIQCNGGKDRTGITVALILESLGVPDETIVDDYVLTDEVRSRVTAPRYEQALSRLVAVGLDPAILETRRETMLEFLEGFRERWISASEYAMSAGVTADVIRSLRENLLEPVISPPR